MKKFLSLLLAVLMIASMSTTAFAVTSTGGTYSVDVQGVYQAATPPADKISVDITWGAMNFTYRAKDYQTDWDPETHTYKNSYNAGWSAEGNDITVVNHSNVAVTAAFAFTSTAGELTTSFTNSTINLATAENTAVADAPSGNTSFNITGGTITQTGGLGNIAVTIYKQQQGN